MKGRTSKEIHKETHELLQTSKACLSFQRALLSENIRGLQRGFHCS